MFNKFKIVIVMAAICLSLLLNLMKKVQEVIVKTFKPMLDTKKNRLYAAEHEGIGIFKNVVFVFYKIPQYGLRNRAGKMIFLPTLPNPNASVIATLNLSGVHDADVTLMKLIRTKCTGNAYVTIIIGTLTALDALIDTYENAHGPARAVALVPLVEALNAIMALFQTCANLPANKSNSIVIIQSGGFHVKGKGGAHDRIFAAEYGVNSGEIHLTCPTNDAACYEWWYSPDNINWTRMQGSTVSETTITGLPVGKIAYFKYQHIIGNTGQGISTPIQKMVV